jgi:protein-L-isoaspartate(D-aspartate) O-methyltransferase
MIGRAPGLPDLLNVIVESGVRDARVIGAFERVPRTGFVPPELVDRAYLDQPLPIPHGQVTTQPSLIARMIEPLGLAGEERVLEIGTGYGFQTALLAALGGQVWSVERWPDLAAMARANLERHGVARKVVVVVGDGSEGLAEHAPFDAIVVSAAFPRVPEPLSDQLVSGGRIVHPVGSGGMEEVALFERTPRGLKRRRTLTGARFVRLYGRYGFSEEPGS